MPYAHAEGCVYEKRWSWCPGTTVQQQVCLHPNAAGQRLSTIIGPNKKSSGKVRRFVHTFTVSPLFWRLNRNSGQGFFLWRWAGTPRFFVYAFIDGWVGMDTRVQGVLGTPARSRRCGLTRVAFLLPVFLSGPCRAASMCWLHCHASNPRGFQWKSTL